MLSTPELTGSTSFRTLLQTFAGGAALSTNEAFERCEWSLWAASPPNVFTASFFITFAQQVMSHVLVAFWIPEPLFHFDLAPQIKAKRADPKATCSVPSPLPTYPIIRVEFTFCVDRNGCQSSAFCPYQFSFNPAQTMFSALHQLSDLFAKCFCQ